MLRSPQLEPIAIDREN